MRYVKASEHASSKSADFCKHFLMLDVRQITPKNSRMLEK